MRLCGQYVLPAVVLTLLLFLTSVWLPQGTIQDCKLSWLPCLSMSSETDKVDSAVAAGRVFSASHDDVIINHNNINNNNNNNETVIEVCPGQNFQVSRLLLYLNSALGPSSDILLEPYLLCWEELIKFMEALGPVVGLFSGKVQEKISLIRRLMEEEAAKFDLLTPPDPQLIQNPQRHAYSSVHSMLEAELLRGVVSFERRTDSGSRTLLRLHRSLLWLQLLLEKVVGESHGDGRRGDGGDGDGRRGDGGRGDGGRSLGALCAEAYEQALAPYHPWLLQQAAQLAFRAMPGRSVLLHIVCVHTQEEAEPIIHTIITAIREVHHRTQRELEQRNMMNLP